MNRKKFGGTVGRVGSWGKLRLGNIVGVFIEWSFYFCRAAKSTVMLIVSRLVEHGMRFLRDTTNSVVAASRETRGKVLFMRESGEKKGNAHTGAAGGLSVAPKDCKSRRSSL